MLVLTNWRFCDQSFPNRETFGGNLHLTIYFGIWHLARNLSSIAKFSDTRGSFVEQGIDCYYTFL